MKVKLIQMTQNPIDVMWTAARTCYSAKSPIEMWEDLELYHNVIDGLSKTEDIELITDKQEQTEKHWNLVKKVLDSGHLSICEHVYFTFLIEGVSRALLAQLTRHRTGIVFSVMSQRYVEIKEDIPNILRWEEAKPILDKYFIDVNTSNWQEYLDCLKHYLHHIQMGMKAEDARNILPNATKTNITMSINLRELIHVSNLRLCLRSQAEIRQLFQAIKKEVKEQDERLASLLVPSCEVHGFCTEHQCCGRKPPLNKVLEDYHKYKDLNK